MMLRTRYATPSEASEGSSVPVGATIIDAVFARERAHRSVSRRVVDLSDVEVDDVRATALAWLSDIARG